MIKKNKVTPVVEDKSVCDYRLKSPFNKQWKAITDEGFHKICQSDTQQITNIYLDDNQITIKGVRSMLGRNWTSLTDLSLAGNKIGAKGCKYLSHATLNNLKYLNLSRCAIGNEGIVHLSKVNWKELKQISLKQSKMAMSGIKSLTKLNQQQTIISVRFNKIAFEQMNFLLLLESKQIAQLYIWSELIGKQNQVRLKNFLTAKFQKCKVYQN